MQRIPYFLATYKRLLNKGNIVIKIKRIKGGYLVGPHSKYIQLKLVLTRSRNNDIIKIGRHLIVNRICS